ncbi:MAG: hypothetical protein ABFD50_23600 [Smithella sp.]
MREPIGIKITSIFLILHCVTQLVPLILLASRHGPDALIIIFIILGSILPLMGLVSAIGLFCMRVWGQNTVILFSQISIAFYGISIPLSCTLEGFSGGLVIPAFFLLVYLLSLPIWCSYYLSSPPIAILFKKPMEKKPVQVSSENKKRKKLFIFDLISNISKNDKDEL